MVVVFNRFRVRSADGADRQVLLARLVPRMIAAPVGLEAVPSSPYGAMAPGEEVPVTIDRLRGSLASARYWTQELPRYADRKQKHADIWAILAGISSGVTGLSVWPLLSEGSGLPPKVLLSTMAFLSLLCGLMPRVKNYAELAASAREIASQYGNLTGMLADLVALAGRDGLDDRYQHSARATVTQFEKVKAKKDLLQDLPLRSTREDPVH